MKKRLRLLTSLLALAFAQSVFGLGLGEITAESALNEPLEARIELLNVGSLSDQELIVQIGTPYDYRIAGVEREYFHTSIEFEPHIEGTSGKPYVRLTTKTPVQEPYLNFVVQVRWPQGKLLREYTLLLDLPVFTGREEAQTVSQPQAEAPVERVSRPQPQTVRTQAPATIPSTGAPIVGGEYRVQSGDTLWSLAGRVAEGADMGRHQVMLAIRDLNPEAFVNGDPNSLQAGRLIRLPSEEQANRRTLTQAISEFAAIQEGQGSVAATPISSSAPSNFREQSTSDSSTGGRLSLSSSSALGSGSGNAEALEEENLSLKEELDRAELENEDLRSRLTSLEEQLEVSRALLEVEDNELANVQAGLAAANDDSVTANADVAASADTEEMAAAPQAEAVIESEPATEEPSPAPVVVAPEPEQPEPGLFARLISFLPYLGGLVVIVLLIVMFLLKRRGKDEDDDIWDGDLDDEASPLDKPLDEASKSEGDQDFDQTSVMNETASFQAAEDEDQDELESMDELFGSTDEDDDTSEAGPEPAPEEAAMDMDNVDSEDVEDIDLEAALEDLDDFADLDSFGKDEIEDFDLEEAAGISVDEDEDSTAVEEESVAKEESEDDSEEDSNELDFESLELPEAEEDEPEDTDDANAMEFDIGDIEAPSAEDDEDEDLGPAGNEMEFDSADIELPDTEEDDDAELDLGNSMDFDADIDLPEEDASEDEPEEAAGNEMEFDANSLELPESDEDEDDSELDAGNSMDFDIGDIELPEADADAGESEVDEADEGDSLELPDTDDLDLPEDDSDEDMDDLLSGLDDEVPDVSDLDADEGEDSGSDDDLGLDLDDDFDLGGDDDLLQGLDEDTTEEVGDLAEEMATKIELADAYIEMGDVRGAKELIDEIMADGNDDQKAEASKLAERIEGLI